MMSNSYALLVSTLLLVTISISACSSKDEQHGANALIEEMTVFQGRNDLDRTHIQFDFRNYSYNAWRYDGQYRYSRSFEDDSLGDVLDVLDNDGVYRFINGTETPQTTLKRNSIETDVNSVVYFALLPYNLTDPAVISEHLGSDSIDGVEYDVLEVTFKQEGGGRDYEDRFIYWIDKAEPVIEYMAYYYHTDGGGSRFRKAVNRRRSGGILFADYLNYKANPDTVGSAVENFGRLFNDGAVEQVSEIRLDSLHVTALDSFPRFQ